MSLVDELETDPVPLAPLDSNVRVGAKGKAAYFYWCVLGMAKAG